MADPKSPTELAPNEPYPTGNPPDPMEEYYKAHPERKLAEEQAAAAEKDAKKNEKSQSKPEPEAKTKAWGETEDEETEDKNRYGKGKK